MARGWKAEDIPDLTGRTTVVTGATSGLGRETALQLAIHGATVVLAVRDAERGEATARAIRGRAPGATVSVGSLDLADLEDAGELPGIEEDVDDRDD